MPLWMVKKLKYLMCNLKSNKTLKEILAYKKSLSNVKIDENIEYDIKEENGNTIYVNIKGEEAKFLIGYRGEVLNALQTIFVAVAGKNIEEKIHVNVDILGYREKRRKVLEDLAQRVAKTVITRKKSVTLEPMTAFERKIIHTKLQDNEKVKTESIGEGEHRRIVVSLK